MRSSWAALLAVVLVASWIGSDASPDDWVVSITLHEAFSKTNADGGGSDDIYAKMRIAGAVPEVLCNTKRVHRDGERHIFPEWVCQAPVSGGPGEDPAVSLVLELWEHDGTLFTGPDDRFDIHPSSDRKSLAMTFRPRSLDLSIDGVPGWETPRCAGGKIEVEGSNGEDQARVEFSVSASLPGTLDGDSDGDGLLDAWEVCGTENLDLPSMGADPLRKDLFVEVDWMVDDDGLGGDDHSHEPWLPSLINAWHELQLAPVTNPPRGAVPGRPGIDLHVDVGNLFAGFSIDLNPGLFGPEINVGDCTPGQDLDLNGDTICESLDLDGDGRVDIGDLGGGARIPGQEDQVLSICDDDSEVGNLKQAFFDPARLGVFRYSVFGHQYDDSGNCSSGYACAEDLFIVTLGCVGPGATNGASGLPLVGSIAQHTGTFLHEMGHTLGLPHGGVNGVNFKPNYLSIMNYHFQFGGINYDLDGDGMRDRLPGIDFDRDGINDWQRFTFSRDRTRIALDERSLDESQGARDPLAPGFLARSMTLHGPWPIRDGMGTCTRNCGMVPICDPNCILAPETNQPIDWSRDGDTADTGVSSLGPPYPGGISTDLNNDGSLDLLEGFYDYDVLQNGGLRPRTDAAIFGPGLTPQDAEELNRIRQSVVPLPDEASLRAKCDGDLTVIQFEDFAVGTEVVAQYLPPVAFLRDGLRVPTIEGNDERGSVPTQSPTRSLVNRFFNRPAPLVAGFSNSMRMVGLYVGRTTPGDVKTDTVVLRAFDPSEQPMGEVRAPIPDVTAGITGFIGVGASFPDRLIGAIEVRYEGPSTSSEPVHIDDLILCTTKTEQKAPLEQPPPPEFGDESVRVSVKARLVGSEPIEQGEHFDLTDAPLPDVPILLDGEERRTEFEFSRNEGKSAQLEAAETVPGAAFLHWELVYAVGGASIFFPAGDRLLDLTLMRSGELRAVYGVDDDGDGFADVDAGDRVDNCPEKSNADQADRDQDGRGDLCDNCGDAPNGPDAGTCTKAEAGLLGEPCAADGECGPNGFCSRFQEDANQDGLGDACDPTVVPEPGELGLLAGILLLLGLTRSRWAGGSGRGRFSVVAQGRIELPTP